MRHMRLVTASFVLTLMIFAVTGRAATAHSTSQHMTHATTPFTKMHVLPRCITDGDGCDDEHCNKELNNEGCDGADPIAGNCVGGNPSEYTLTIPGGYVDLRYASNCLSNWGRVRTTGANANLYVYIERIASAPDGGYAKYTASGNGTSWYSDMAFAPVSADKTRACGSINGGTVYCTPYF